MGKLKISDENLKKFTAHFNEVKKLTENAFKKVKVDTSFHDGSGKHIDQRDFFDLALGLHVKGDTLEERQADMDRQVSDMVDAFLSPNPERKNKYLDMIYNLLDKSPSFLNNEIKDQEDFQDMMCSISLNQCFAVKRNEYPEYYSNRYNTSEKILNKSVCMASNDLLGSMVQTLKDTKVPELNMKGFTSYEMMMDIGYETIFGLTSSLGKSIPNGNRVVDFDVPESYLKDGFKQFKDKISFTKTFDTYFSNIDLTLNFGKYVGLGSDNRQLASAANELIYINDKTLEELAVAETNKQGVEPRRINIDNIAETILRKELLQGKSIITVVSPIYIDNKMQYELFNLKPNVTSIRETNKDNLEELNKKEVPEQSEIDKLYEKENPYSNYIKERTEKFLKEQKDLYLTRFAPPKDKIETYEDVAEAGVDIYEEQMQLLETAKNEIGIPTEGIDVDTLSKIAMFFEVKGETYQEKQDDMNRQYHDMVKVFIGDDEEAKSNYMEKYFTEYQKTTLAFKKDITSPEQFKNIIASTQMADNINKNIPKYKTAIGNVCTDASGIERFNTNMLLHKAIDQNVKDIYDALPHENPLIIGDKLSENSLSVAFAKSMINQNLKQKLDYTLDIPNDLNKDTEFNNKLVSNFMNSITYTSRAAETLCKDSNLPENTIVNPSGKLFYVGEKCVESLAFEQLRKTKQYKKGTIPSEVLQNQCVKVVKDALTSGTQVVSYVNATDRPGNKGVYTSVVKVKPNLTQLREEERSKHSAFRLKFFDWGPFKIKCPPEQKEIDNLYKNDRSDKTIVQSVNRTMSRIQNAYLKDHPVIEEPVKEQVILNQEEMRKSLAKASTEVVNQKVEKIVDQPQNKIEEPTIEVNSNKG